MTSPRVRPSRVAFLLALVFTAAAVMLPAAWLGRLRDAFPWFSRAISQVERLWPAVDMVHVLIFAALGALAALAFPRARAIVLFGALVAVAAVSELVQFRIPGRTPRLEEFLLDVAAAALALVVVRVAIAGVRRLRGGAGG